MKAKPATRTAAIASLLALAVAACGGGSKQPSGAPILPDTFTLAGTITAASGMVVDGDLGDANAAVVSNDTLTTAQVIPSAVRVGGWVHATLDGVDFYRAALAPGQRVTLAVADGARPDVDLVLCLIPVSDPSTIPCSIGTTIEQLDIAVAGEYYVSVEAVTGQSNYTLTLGVAPAVETLRSDREFVPGEILVQFRRGALAAAAARPLAANVDAAGLELVDGDWDRPSLLRVPRGDAQRSVLGLTRSLAALGPLVDPIVREKLETLAAVKRLRARADVETADPNYIRRASAVPNDTHYPRQWHYPLMNLPLAWDVTTGSPVGGGNDVVVAVVDTGVFLAHPDLAGQLVQGYDFVSNPTISRDLDGIDPNPDDPGDSATLGGSSWHGTHVAGTIAARSNNGAGGAGVSWAAKVMPIRALGAGGGTSADVLNGVRYAAGLANSSGTLPARRADVINLSLGGPGSSATEQATFDAVRAAGVVVVAAAGNENSGTPSFPASYDGVISVSAVDLHAQRARYSNFGPFVDLAAPGGDAAVDDDGDGFPDGVLSTSVDDASGARQPIYRFMQGTSMAAPHVAGLVALVKAVCARISPDRLNQLVAAGRLSVDRGATGRDDVFGHGLVDALKAVRSAETECGAPPAPSLDVTPSLLEVAPGQTAAQLSAAKVGEGPLAITGVTDDADWITVTPATVDAEGFGTYAVSFATDALPDGAYRAAITFAVNPGDAVAIPVSFQKGPPPGPGDAGPVYVLLLDEDLAVVREGGGLGAAGLYPYAFGSVAAGRYFVVAGSDHDGDDFICDDGEACGAWPTLGVPTPLDVAGNRSGLDFVVGFPAELTGTTAAGAAGSPPAGGFRLPDGTKRLAR